MSVYSPPLLYIDSLNLEFLSTPQPDRVYDIVVLISKYVRSGGVLCDENVSLKKKVKGKFYTNIDMPTIYTNIRMLGLK